MSSFSKTTAAVDEWLSLFFSATIPPIIPECQFRDFCEMFKDLLLGEDAVPVVPVPAVLVGDLHGQYYDLIELLRISGRDDAKKNSQFVPLRNYCFLGDYVDRGYNSVETWQLLILLKLKYPSKITLLRGNHESRQVSQAYGLYDEVMRKYGNPSVWKDCVETFDYLPLSAIVGGKIFCVHGGLSPEISHAEQIRQIDRLMELPNEGKFADLMWSDPEESISDWAANPRGAGFVFGSNPVKKFLHFNNFSLIARAHQLVQEGFKYHFVDDAAMVANPTSGTSDGGLVVTVWSAPNYCYRCGNVASVLKLDENLNRDFVIFKETENSTRYSVPTRQTVPYFV